MKILIAEDDDLSRLILHQILGHFGPCDTTVDGAEAVEAFELAWQDDAPYDLVCLDIMMPRMDGQEALKHIRRLENRLGIRGGREVKILMLTALDDPRSVIEAFYRGGATSYLVKPVDLDRLLGELRLMGLVTTAQIVNIAHKEHGSHAKENPGLDCR
jgi:two-component system chemotaxis response regulator CheY